MTRTNADWPSAFEKDGVTYDLEIVGGRPRTEVSRPMFKRDVAGTIIGGRTRTRAEAERIGSDLVRKGKTKRVEINADITEFEEVALSTNLSYDEDIFRLAAKIANNTAVLMGKRDLVKASGVGNYLHERAHGSIRPARCHLDAVRQRRPALSHTVYIEFGPTWGHGYVILFGSMQIYVPMPAAQRGAMLGFLDPVTGEESFRTIEPLNIPWPPERWTPEQENAFHSYVADLFIAEAKSRGATGAVTWTPIPPR